jgi:hypothetical protein
MKYLLKRKIHTSNKDDNFSLNEIIIVWYVNYPPKFGKIIVKSKIDNTYYIKYKSFTRPYTNINWVNKSQLRKVTFL